MENRINWIDWSKAFCMTIVVFCHLPQQKDTFYLQFFGSVILSTFFFISGYLKKQNLSIKESAKKYGKALLIPYLLYNAIYYPYWLAKFYIVNGSVTWHDAIKPLVGTMLGQYNSSISCELNGVTWFLIALFIMHILTDILNHSKYRNTLMLVISIATIILYGANKYYLYAPYITYHGFIRCICFFFLGILFQQRHYLRQISLGKDLMIGCFMLIFSLILFYWHLHEDRFAFHIISFYMVKLVSIFAFIYLAKALDNIKSRIITIISVASMLIFGLHRILIGIIDFGIEKAFNLDNATYDLPTCILLTLVIELALIPLAIYCIKWPILFGKSAQKAISTSA